MPYITPIPFNKPTIKPVIKDTMTIKAALLAYWLPLTKTLKSNISPKKAKDETAKIGPNIVRDPTDKSILDTKKTNDTPNANKPGTAMFLTIF